MIAPDEFIKFIQDNGCVDDLLKSLDKAASEYDSYEYGLPLHDPTIHELRLIIYRWLADLINIQ